MKIILNLEYDGKEYKVEKKEPFEIEECEEGKFVSLHFKNGEEYNGIFRGMDEDDIVLGSVSSCQRIGLPLHLLETYYEEI
jgi:hypothetical protein